MHRIASLFALFMLPSMLWAACAGTDMRPGLTQPQSDELQTRLSATPYASGNHWLAARGAHRIHLIGTIHVADPRLPALVARLTPVIASADILLVEATKAEEDALQNALATRPELLSLTEGPSLIDRMSPEDWAALAEAAQARGIPPFMAAKMQPWYLSLMLGMPPCLLQMMRTGAEGLDKRLLSVAADQGVPARALEPFDTLFRTFAQDPIEDQIEMLRLGVLSVAEAEDAMQTLTAQYFEEHHGAVMPLARITTRARIRMDPNRFDEAFDMLEQALLENRNRAWMDTILTASGQTVVAVGAAHLGGSSGLLNLLALEGYALRRQPF